MENPYKLFNKLYGLIIMFINIKHIKFIFFIIVLSVSCRSEKEKTDVVQVDTSKEWYKRSSWTTDRLLTVCIPVKFTGNWSSFFCRTDLNIVNMLKKQGYKVP